MTAPPGMGTAGVLAHSPRIEVERLDDEIVVWHHDNLAMHRLSGTGAAVFTHVDGHSASDVIAMRLAAEFDVDLADVRAEVLAFLDELVELQLVEPAVT